MILNPHQKVQYNGLISEFNKYLLKYPITPVGQSFVALFSGRLFSGSFPEMSSATNEEARKMIPDFIKAYIISENLGKVMCASCGEPITPDDSLCDECYSKIINTNEGNDERRIV